MYVIYIYILVIYIYIHTELHLTFNTHSIYNIDMHICLWFDVFIYIYILYVYILYILYRDTSMRCIYVYMSMTTYICLF